MGGNSHALTHSELTSHAVAVKLGSITADGTADVFCYKCNEERVDPNLADHLAHWGINLAGREKTEKSLMEMQIEQNMKWQFTMTSEDGQELTPIFGPGLTGLRNLGNSCYLSSVIQCLFDLPQFQNRFYHPTQEPPFSQHPAEDLESQLRKLADGILSGRYSRPDPDAIIAADSPETPNQKGLLPSMFKHLVGRGHDEFSTMRQQDAFEFLLHLFKLVNQGRFLEGLDNPIESFRFAVEQRLQCLNCRKVRYRVDEQDNLSIPVPVRRFSTESGHETSDQFQTVTFNDCLDASTAEEVVELSCPSCSSKAGFSKRSSFKTLPQNLVVNARRFELINWVPTKLDIPVEVGDDPLDLAGYLSSGQKEDEELLPDVENTEAAFAPNEEILSQLLTMGFPQPRCVKALQATGNSDLEAAMNWIFAHMDDPGIDDPPATQSAAEFGEEPQQDLTKVIQLGEMGINEQHAKKALAATGGDINRAIDWVFSHPEEMTEAVSADNESDVRQDNSHRILKGFSTTPARYQLRSIICHKGSSVHAGYAFLLIVPKPETACGKANVTLRRHYVAFVRKTLPGEVHPTWVMFNDEKVVAVEDIREMKKFAYLYFLVRVE